MKSHLLSPFGIEVAVSSPDNRLTSLSIPALRAWVREHRLLVLRGIEPPSDEEMMAFCRQLGEVLEWEFGAVNELQARPDARNYLYTNRAVPFHWDGAFVGRIPHFIFFHCRVAPPPGSGGETLFADTPRMLERILPRERELWDRIRITYGTEKVVHYGGSFTSPLVCLHPVSGQPVVRYAEPVEDLNPVHLEISGLHEEQRPAFLARIHKLLNDPACCYAHGWREGDVVLADNHALLHGRRAFSQAAARHLRRVNIL